MKTYLACLINSRKCKHTYSKYHNSNISITWPVQENKKSLTQPTITVQCKRCCSLRCPKHIISRNSFSCCSIALLSEQRPRRFRVFDKSEDDRYPKAIKLCLLSQFLSDFWKDRSAFSSFFLAEIFLHRLLSIWTLGLKHLLNTCFRCWNRRDHIQMTQFTTSVTLIFLSTVFKRGEIISRVLNVE